MITRFFFVVFVMFTLVLAAQAQKFQHVFDVKAITPRLTDASADIRRADLQGAYLRRADLQGAYLRRADLRRADLRRADLQGAYLQLIGERPIMQISPIGSREDVLLVFITNQGLRFRAGCFFGNEAQFVASIAETHGENKHAQEYLLAVEMARLHAKLWTPAVEDVAEAATEDTQEAAQ